MNIDEALSLPLYGVALTVVVYSFSLILYKKKRWLHPLFITSFTLILIVLLSDTYEAYQVGGEYITFFLGPATIALGVPLYKNFTKIKRAILPLIGGVTAGSISGIASAGLLMYMLGGTEETLLSMLPKSTTAPISIELVRMLGGLPELGAVLTVLTGLLGSMVGPELLRMVGIRSHLAVGVSVGTAAHGIGTARLIRDSEYLGSISAVSMGLSGIITSIAVIPLYWWFL